MAFKWLSDGFQMGSDGFQMGLTVGDLADSCEKMGSFGRYE
jgi:hypothetical protein